MLQNQEKRIDLSVIKAHISEVLNIYTQDENTLHIRHPYSQIKSSSTSICLLKESMTQDLCRTEHAAIKITKANYRLYKSGNISCFDKAVFLSASILQR
jgi:hypothetical protein